MIVVHSTVQYYLEYDLALQGGLIKCKVANFLSIVEMALTLHDIHLKPHQEYVEVARSFSRSCNSRRGCVYALWMVSVSYVIIIEARDCLIGIRWKKIPKLS